MKKPLIAARSCATLAECLAKRLRKGWPRAHQRASRQTQHRRFWDENPLMAGRLAVVRCGGR